MSVQTVKQTPLHDAIGSMASYVRSLVVNSQESYIHITTAYTNARAWKNIIEDRRKELLKPYRDKTAEINDAAKQLTAPLDAVIEEANKKASEYQALVDAAKAKEILEAAALCDIPDDEVLLPQKPSTVYGHGASTSTRVTKKFRVVDLSIVPREYLMLDEKLVQLKIKMGQEIIPGLEVYEESKTTLRVN